MLRLWCHGIECDCGTIVHVNNGWDQCIAPIGSDLYIWNIFFDSGLILSYFLNYFTFHVIKGVKNGSPCMHCGDQRRLGFCLDYVSALACGSCNVCDQGHYNDVIMTTIASQITSLTIVYSIVYSDVDQSKHQSSASLAFVRGIHRGPVRQPCVPLMSTMRGQPFLIPLA